MSGYFEHAKRGCLDIIEKTCGMMINDTYSFVFLRSEGLDFLKRYSLGGGNFLMVIGQFAVLNYLAKIYSILCKGEDVYITKKDIDEFVSIKDDLVKNHEEIWKKIKTNIRKPRTWDFINETGAFVKLIQDYPGDLGIPKDSGSIKKVWRDYRNKLSHIATIGNNNISVTLEFPAECKTYKQAKDLIKSSKGKPFLIIPSEEKSRLEREIFIENNKKCIATSTDVIWRATADKLLPDLLSRDIQQVVSWVIAKIENDGFENENLKDLYDWLLMQHYVSK